MVAVKNWHAWGHRIHLLLQHCYCNCICKEKTKIRKKDNYFFLNFPKQLIEQISQQQNLNSGIMLDNKIYSNE